MTIIHLLLALALTLFGLASGTGDPPRDEAPVMRSAATPFATETAPNALHKATAIAQSPEKPQVSETDKVLTNIHDVAIRVMESFPMRISLEVSGEHPDGCEFPVQVTQRRDGDVVSVQVFRQIPSDVFCPMILKPYRDTIHLDGDFTFGAITIRVNDHSQTIEL